MGARKNWSSVRKYPGRAEEDAAPPETYVGEDGGAYGASSNTPNNSAPNNSAEPELEETRAVDALKRSKEQALSGLRGECIEVLKRHAIPPGGRGRIGQ